MNQTFENLFHSFSKWVLFIPIVIIVLGLYVRFSRSTNIQTLPIESPTVVPPQTTPETTFKFDLEGPAVCDVILGSDEAHVYIKSKNIKATLVKNKLQKSYLLKGDCLYQWTEASFSGEKRCGLSPLIAMAGVVPLDLKTILAFFPSSSLSQVDPEKVQKSCKKVTIDEKLFTLPTTILFKNSSQ